MKSTALRLLALTLALLGNRASAQIIIPINNSGQQTFAVDYARHLLFAGENGPTSHHLNVINTLTNTVVGSYSYVGGWSSQIDVSGNNVVWADQGDSLVRVIAVSNAGVPTLTRTDSATLATGVAGLPSTYAVSMQGTGDLLKIMNTSTGIQVGSSISLGGVAGGIFSDSNTNRFYARSTNSFKVIDATNGAVLRTLSGFVQAVDSSPSHNFVYFLSGANTQQLLQLNGVTNSQTAFYDFGAGASVTYVTTDPLTGNVFVGLQSQNRVVELSSGMAFVQQFSLTSPEALAYADGELFVHLTGTTSFSVLAIPEPGTTQLLLGGLAMLTFIRLRRTVHPAA